MSDDTGQDLDESAGAQVRPFAEFIREQRRGGLHDDLGNALQELVEACLATGKAGTLKLTLKVTPSDASEFAHLEVADDVDVKPPKPDRPSSIFFADRSANLVRNDPRQQSLGLREVDRTTGEIKEAR